MATFPHHERLRLVNFTAFTDASFEWSPGINAIIGTNGTGKTHLLKLLYAAQYDGSRPNLLKFFTSVENVFQVRQLSEVVRLGNNRGSLSGRWNGVVWNYDVVLKPDEGKIEAGVSTEDGKDFPSMSRPIFIPSVDMIGHTKGFPATYDEYEIDFDQTYRDIVSALLSPPLRNQVQVAERLKPLAEILNGEVELQGERFYLKTPQGLLPMPMVAEGLRKVATLYTLVKNGYLRPGDTLFWDEPETNLSPVVMDEVIAVLLQLARSGVQIFLTTHNYFILKELDLQAKADDQIRFFGLYSTPEGTKVETADEFPELQHNPIMEQADSVYDREVTRATGRRRKK